MKALLRHEIIATTSQVYGRLELEAKRRAQQRLIDYVVLEAEAQAWKGAPAQLAAQTA